MSLSHKHAPKVKCTRAAFCLGLVVLLACALAHAVGVSAQGGSPGTLSFSQAEYDVSEGVGNANITLTRTGGTDGAVTAKVSLTDVTTSPADYLIAPGSVHTSFGFRSINSCFFERSDVAIQPGGKLLVVAPVPRMSPDGTPDRSFRGSPTRIFP